MQSFGALSSEVDIDPENPNSGKVNRITTHHLNDDEQTEVDKEDLIKGIRYGNEYVPWDEIAQTAFKEETTKCLQVIVLEHHSLAIISMVKIGCQCYSQEQYPTQPLHWGLFHICISVHSFHFLGQSN